MLEDHLREAARTGRLRHVLLARTDKGFQASFQHADGTCRVDIRPDPVDAMLVAVGAVGTLEMNAQRAEPELSLEDMLA